MCKNTPGIEKNGSGTRKILDYHRAQGTYLGIAGVLGFVVAVGDNGVIAHFTGDDYRPRRVDSHTTAHLYAVWVASERCAWAVGDHGVVLRWDGKRWSTVTIGSREDELFAVWSCPGDGIWIGGRDTLIVHHPATGSEGTIMHTESTLIGIWGSGPDDVWFLCSGRLVLHWNGTECSAHPLPGEGEDDYCAIGGSGPEDPVWIVGRGGAMVSGDGTDWDVIDSGTEATLLGVCASGPEDVWVTTHTGQLRHWNGVAWEVAAKSVFGYLGSVCLVDGVVWCAGKNAVLQHRPQDGESGE